MKAKFIAVKDKFEMRLENGTIIESKPNEKKAVFLKRVKDEASLDVGDLEITELKAESFSGLSLEQLKTAKEKGLLVALINEAIAIKEKAVVASEMAAKKLADKEAAKKAKEEAKGPKLSPEEVVAAAIAALEKVMEAATIAKENVGHAITFNPHRTVVKTVGVINGVWIDKRVPMALYRIFDEDGNMYNKTIDASDLEIGDLVPNPKIEAKEKAKAEKETKAKEAAEAKEKAKAEKIEAAEAKEKAKAEKIEAAIKAKAEKETKVKTEAAKKVVVEKEAKVAEVKTKSKAAKK